MTSVASSASRRLAASSTGALPMMQATSGKAGSSPSNDVSLPWRNRGVRQVTPSPASTAARSVDRLGVSTASR